MSHTSVFFAFGSPAQCRIETRDVGDGAHACRHGLRRDPRGTARLPRAPPPRSKGPALRPLGARVPPPRAPARDRNRRRFEARAFARAEPPRRERRARLRASRASRASRAPRAHLVCPRRAHVGAGRVHRGGPRPRARRRARGGRRRLDRRARARGVLDGQQAPAGRARGAGGDLARRRSARDGGGRARAPPPRTPRASPRPRTSWRSPRRSPSRARTPSNPPRKTPRRWRAPKAR